MPPSQETLAYYETIPVSILVGLQNYVFGHREVGSFLNACLCNDFVNAVCRADSESLEGIKQIAHFIHNEIPSACHGSPQDVSHWLGLDCAVDEPQLKELLEKLLEQKKSCGQVC